MACAPLKAWIKDATLSTSPLTTSTPLPASALLDALLGSRVTPRTFQPGSLRNVLTTDPPFKMSAKLEVRGGAGKSDLLAGSTKHDNGFQHDVVCQAAQLHSEMVSVYEIT